MAAKSKKRLYKIENKLFKLEKLELEDIFCPICKSILIEPVTLPCFHDFCQRCFNGSIENNALCCPMCRMRFGSWLRTATKQKNLVNVELWNFIKTKFSYEVDIKLKGEDLPLPEENQLPRLCEPGEIRSEYEAELKRLREERLHLEKKHLQETELLIKKIQEEEEEAQRTYNESLKEDELLALKIQQHHSLKTAIIQRITPRKDTLRRAPKPRLKATKIDRYLASVTATSCKDSPLLTDDNSSLESSTPITTTAETSNVASPEMVPGYGKLIKNINDKKTKPSHAVWNKENGDSGEDKNEESRVSKQTEENEDNSNTKKSIVPSLVVSLPLQYTGILQHKLNTLDNRNLETGSADSMHQELCFFKPIDGTTPTSFSKYNGTPLKVPGVRQLQGDSSPVMESPPSRAQYLEGLSHLRHLSLAKNLPSAFVISLSALTTKKESAAKCVTNLRSKVKKTAYTSPSSITTSLPVKRNGNAHKHSVQVDGINKHSHETNLRRTRSMGSISKDENETTPKKAKVKQRKVSSERKPYLRSDSKKSKRDLESPPLISESLNNYKMKLAVKNLSSPLKNCDVKKILQEQLRIEKIIEQEKNDFEMALKVDAEWNGRRQLRRVSLKRQVTLNYALRPPKKLKV